MKKLALLLLFAGCVDPVGGTDTSTTSDSASSSGSATAGDTTAGDVTTADTMESTTMAPPLSCGEAMSEADCAAAQPGIDPISMGPCLWVPQLRVTEVGGTCSFEPAGGTCLSPMAGDTDCGSYQASCGYDAYYSEDMDGNTIIARISASCAYWFGGEMTLAWCQNDPDPMTEPLPALACTCACAAEYPD